MGIDPNHYIIASWISSICIIYFLIERILEYLLLQKTRILTNNKLIKYCMK